MSVTPSEPSSITVSLSEVVSAYRLVRASEATLAPRGMSVFMVVMLATVAERPGTRIGTLARGLGFNASFATGGIDRLERRGLVVRTARASIAGDRRAIGVDLTDAGRAMLAELAEITVKR